MSKRLNWRRTLLSLAAAAMAATAAAGVEAATLTVVPQANVTILDPIWTTAYTARNHGYMIYDTLFGTDEAGKVQPQMVEKWESSPDQRVWTFTLRDGLAFHDGSSVTSADVIASLKRWASRDTMGGTLARVVESYEAVDDKTFRIKTRDPYGIMLDALGKPSSNVPFIMPKRIADTPGTEQIKESIGSGPYKFVAAEYKPGEKVVYVKNENYKPRAEPASGTAGGKNVYVDRVEWRIIRDPQTQLNALLSGEVDVIEQPAFEQYPTLTKSPDIKLVDMQHNGLQYVLRFNHLHPPFNDQKIRRAALLAMGQSQILRTQVGSQDLITPCRSMYPCGTQYGTEIPGFTGVADPAAAKKLLQEAGYDGKPVVLLRPTDLAIVAKLPLVAKQQLEQAGFKVDLQTMDWQSLVARRARRDAPDAGGWNIFMTSFAAEDLLNPVSMPMMNATGATGFFGWQDDPALEKIKSNFVQATTVEEKKSLAAEAQARAFEAVSHVPLGQFHNPAAARKNINGLLPAGVQVYWNVRKD
ncbi:MULTISPECIES: ABC transporter substrate-binding protein [Achromobacter]|uniref:ABC transporter substrate-binding protein n=1 Tax=Achromobacter sp. TaxID=134375 RepID=UPI002F9362B7